MALIHSFIVISDHQTDFCAFTVLDFRVSHVNLKWYDHKREKCCKDDSQ